MSPLNTICLLSLLSLAFFVSQVEPKKNNAPESESEDTETGKGKGVDRERFYKKKDLERITELMAEIGQLQNYLADEHAFLTDLLISSLSMPKPQVAKVDNLLQSTRNMTKTLTKFYNKNSLSGRPQKMVAKRLERMARNIEDEA